MTSLNELYNFTHERFGETPVSIVFGDKLPKRFASDTAYIILYAQNASLSEIYARLKAKYPLSHAVYVFN